MILKFSFDRIVALLGLLILWPVLLVVAILIKVKMPDLEVAVWYNDNVIYPDKVRLNCYYYRHYSFVKDIQMILCTVLGKKMRYAGEELVGHGVGSYYRIRNY